MARQQQGRGSRVIAIHESFLRYAHFRWLKIALVIGLIAIACFLARIFFTDFDLRHSGSGWFGYTTGTMGAGLIVWLAALGVRKRLMTDGAWSLKAWVSAHVYLGLSLVVIVSLHSGFQFGWNIHTLAYALMMLVILSGIFGIITYVRLPQKLSDNRGETTQKQMLEIIRTLDGRLLEIARPLEHTQAVLVRRSVHRTRIGGSFWRRLSGNHSNCATLEATTQLSVARMSMPKGAQAQAVDHILGLLAEKRTTLAKARRHIQLRSLLEVWLYVHIPTTLALIAALAAHIVSVFFFW
ncbi:MAG: hypothetical protein RL274_1706 [Pseudomonadota bacterium]